ncbi:MAG: TetR/AcrR family transcriptional regulator [Pseudarcicella sp.]|jgi:hypothetical protein|nr:TetR/AcrR family transcriptional regulator [Pseudarcicella sp.]MBP6411127.1 TetR/AcrR family transcriptional regulator [Pseudarcicella sp.]
MTKLKQIKQSYIEFILENGSQPASIYAFAKKLKIKESEFYDYYNSFNQIDTVIWLDIFEETVSKIQNEATFQEYSVREKMLAFYYTWIELLKENRSYISHIWQNIPKVSMHNPAALVEFKIAFKNFVSDLMQEGKASNEVQSRKFIDTKYPDVFWLQALFILDFWVKDHSKGFEKTDAVIEKSVNTSFDLIASSALDSVLDFAKFMYQNKK